MQTGVFPLVVEDMHGNFLGQVQRLAVGGLETFEVGREDVVGLAGGNALGKLTVMVGVEFPAHFAGFVLGTANLDPDTIHRTIIRPPDGTEDESVGLPRFRVLCGGTQKWQAQAEKDRKGHQERGR